MDLPVNISPSLHWSSSVRHKDETMMEKVKTSVKFQSELRLPATGLRSRVLGKQFVFPLQVYAARIFAGDEELAEGERRQPVKRVNQEGAKLFL